MKILLIYLACAIAGASLGFWVGWRLFEPKPIENVYYTEDEANGTR